MNKLLFLSAVAVLLVGTGAASGCKNNNSSHKTATYQMVNGKPVSTKVYKCGSTPLEPADFVIINGISTCTNCGCSEADHTA
jgi:hypothetical protein